MSYFVPPPSLFSPGRRPRTFAVVGAIRRSGKAHRNVRINIFFGI